MIPELIIGFIGYILGMISLRLWQIKENKSMVLIKHKAGGQRIDKDGWHRMIWQTWRLNTK